MSNSAESRRTFLTASGLTMTASLALGYGRFGTMLGQFVYPAESHNLAWLFVCPVESLPQGAAMDFITPSGAKIVVAHQGAGLASEDFLALSSVCPHLGCRVHWEGPQDRFFCPCHNGAFDRSGNPISGPPKAANQPLMRFPLKVEGGLLFLEAPVAQLAQRGETATPDVEGTA